MLSRAEIDKRLADNYAEVRWSMSERRALETAKALAELAERALMLCNSCDSFEGCLRYGENAKPCPRPQAQAALCVWLSPVPDEPSES